MVDLLGKFTNVYWNDSMLFCCKNYHICKENVPVHQMFMDAFFNVKLYYKRGDCIEVYLRACNALGKPAANCIGFEDSLTGIQALQKAGVKCVVVGSALTWKSLIAAE